MGRLIDTDEVSKYVIIGNGDLKKCPTVEAIPKAEYETRLKADMVAMLEDLDLQIDEIPIVTRHGVTETMLTAQGMRKKIKENIQQKIDKLKKGA